MRDGASLTRMTPEFDTLGYAQRLEHAGVPKDQAAVHASALGDVLAHVVFSRQLTEVESRLRNDIGNAEQRVRLEIQIVRTELKAEIRQLRWMFATLLGINVAILVKVLLP